MVSKESVRAYNHAYEAARWARKVTDQGETNFERLYRMAKLETNKGRFLTSSRVRTLSAGSNNNYTAALSRWLMMADWELCGWVSVRKGELDTPENITDFAQLYKHFGIKKTSRDQLHAQKRYERAHA